MTDLHHLPASELCALAEKWLKRLKASKGRDLPLRFFPTKEPETMPDPLDVFRELVERVKAKYSVLEFAEWLADNHAGFAIPDMVLQKYLKSKQSGDVVENR